MTTKNSADVDAVLSLADHMHRMSAEAESIAEEFLPRAPDSSYQSDSSDQSAANDPQDDTRDYFTPSEDDRITSLWISFIKARAALLEILTSLRESYGEIPEESDAHDPITPEQAEVFLAGYLAALVLVDAARTLRDRFSDSKRLRRKLNESYPLYGITSNHFESIQLSLTRPENALGMRQASDYFDNNQAAFVEKAKSNPNVDRLLTRVNALRHCTDVSAARYVKARAKDRTQQVSRQIVAGSAERAIYAIQRWGSRLVSSISTDRKHVSKLPNEVAKCICEFIRPGDVFVTRKECAVTNYFLPGFWPHAAMYVGQSQVVESLKDGVRVRDMDSPFGNDCIAVIRPQLSEDDIQTAIERAHTHVGKEYDFDFDFTRADRMVCTEVVYRSYEGVGGLVFELTKRAGRRNLSAEDLLRMAMIGKHFMPVAAYSPGHSNDIYQSEQMLDLMRVTIGGSAQSS